MSYDLAVWVGQRPMSNRTAGQEFERRADAAEEDVTPPGPQVRAFVADLLERWPEGRGDGVWSVEPILWEEGGDFLHLNMTFRAPLDDLVKAVGELARKHGLVAYDPQQEGLI